MSDSDDDCLSRTVTSERSDAEYVECFADSLRNTHLRNHDPFAPANDDDYFLQNHNVVGGIYTSSLVCPPEDEFPIGCKVFIVADLKELKQTMGPYFFEEKMFRLMGGARRIIGKVLRHHGDYTVVEFVMPLEDMFSGSHTRKLGGGGFRRTSMQHRGSISLTPNGQTLFPNVSSAVNKKRRESIDEANALNQTCAPPTGLDETQTPQGLTVILDGSVNSPYTQGNGASVSPGGRPEIKSLSLGGLGGGSGGLTSSRGRASPRTPRGGSALLSPRTAAAMAEKICVSYTLHRSVIEVVEEGL